MIVCPTQNAIIWHEFCQVRYSYWPFYSWDGYTRMYPDSNKDEKNISDSVGFVVVLKDFMNKLSDQAAFNPSNLMFATGKTKISTNEVIYGHVQCTRDISRRDCRVCLNFEFGDLDGCCEYRQGGTVLSRNCNMKFQLYLFYNEPTVNGNRKKIKVAMLVTGPTTFVLTGLAAGCCVIRHQRSNRTQKDEEKSQSTLLRELANPPSVDINQEGEFVNSQELPFMELATIKAATGNFSNTNKLGQGGFGTVYKGILCDGKEINEVILIAKLQHRNLVRLVGCGIEGEEKLLIYEYMPSKSLDLFIFDSEKRAKLHWDIRLNIILGIARALIYLHEDSRLKIINRDLKPNNVLLDQEMVAKISDFGMARIFGENQNIANTKRVVGTYYRVILLEIISGQRNSGFYLTEHAQTLLAYALRLWSDGKELEFLDPLLAGSCPVAEVVTCIHIGLLCVQEDPKDRPNMSYVVVLLGSESATLLEPNQPAFSVGRVAHIEPSSSTDPSVKNQVTVSGISLQEGWKGKTITVSISISLSAFLVPSLLGACMYYQRRRKRAKTETNSQEVQLLDLGGQFCDDYNNEKLLGDKHTKSQDFPSIQLDLIRAATKHFSGENKLGEGGFGPVYKGILSDGKEIAVKRLKKFWLRITRVQE
ncbi:unnamed protein product [Camellia sinensis]